MAHTGTTTGTGVPIGPQVGPDGQPLTGMAAMMHYINARMQSDPEYAAQVNANPTGFLGPGFAVANGQVTYSDPGGGGFNWTEAALIAAGAATAGIAIPAILGVGGEEAVTAAGVTETAADTTAATAPEVASTSIPFDASTAATSPLISSGSTVGMVPGPSLDAAGNVVQAAGVGGTSTTGALGQLLNAAGKGIGAATTAAGQNQLNAGNVAIAANNSNTAGESAYANEMMGLHNAEQTQRGTDQTNVARASFLENQKPGPFNTQGLTPLSPNYVSTLNALSNQGTQELSTGPKYGATSLPTPPPYVPLNPAQFTMPSTLQQIGNYAAPIASTIGALAQYYG